MCQMLVVINNWFEEVTYENEIGDQTNMHFLFWVTFQYNDRLIIYSISIM